MHKLYGSQPYDDIVGMLGEAHYDALAAAVAEPLHGAAFRPRAADALLKPTTQGPGYDRADALTMIRENYEDLPLLLAHTLPRALADAPTTAGFRALREEGWLDWHLLVAIINAAWNVRAHSSGLLSRTDSQAREQLKRLALQPETAQSTPIPLAALTPDKLRGALHAAVLAVALRRWKLSSSLATPNVEALAELLKSRYCYATDDVAHRDLLSEALTVEGTLLPLIVE